jgi:hypothetical protein
MPAQQTNNIPDMVLNAIRLTGFRFDFVASYQLDQLADESRVQVRIDRNVAPTNMRDRYAAAMKAGAQFGPIVVTRDAYKVDGNTRVAACRILNRHDFPAVVIDVNYEGADTDTLNRLVLLGGILNQHNGLPLNRDETRREVEAAIAQDWTNEAISRHLGVKPGAIVGARRELAAQARMKQLDLDPDDFDSAVLRSLGTHTELHDEPFRELATLAKDAGLGATDVKMLAKRVEETSSDSSAMTLISEERDGLTEQIGTVATSGGGRSHRPATTRVKMILGQLVKPEWLASPTILVDHRPDSADYIKTLVTARDLLNRVIDLQEAVA